MSATLRPGGAVKTIIFDVGGVLIQFDFLRLALDLSRRTGQEPERLLPCSSGRDGREGPCAF
jgi:hypothetical protein